jgi:hypothetical protein
MRKLCFPVLGMVASGKTFWLAMAYRQLINHAFPKEIRIAQGGSPAFGELAEMLDDILTERIAPAATQGARIPHPLIFNFLDHDHLGRSNILLNIFDYSGVVMHRTLLDTQRQRALKGDGFLFFLDPTMRAEEQSRALEKFRQDLYEIEGVRIGQQICTPIALCVSKIDLMINMPYSDYVDPSTQEGPGPQRSMFNRFYEGLREIGWRSDLESIEARSRLMASLCEVIWPAWQIERQIDALFGGRFKYFPMSPVGLCQLGESDLIRRDLAPVGLLDPVLWLLQMNGYPVLR